MRRGCSPISENAIKERDYLRKTFFSFYCLSSSGLNRSTKGVQFFAMKESEKIGISAMYQWKGSN